MSDSRTLAHGCRRKHQFVRIGVSDRRSVQVAGRRVTLDLRDASMRAWSGAPLGSSFSGDPHPTPIPLFDDLLSVVR